MRISTLQYQQMLERTQRNVKREVESINPVARESDLHDEIEKYCRQKAWICFHGSMAHRTMRTKGENDFHCLLPNGIVLFVECKTKTGKLTPEQLGLSLWMEKLGHKMHVVRSFKEFLILVQSYLPE